MPEWRTSMPYSLASIQIPSAESPICGVLLEPCVQFVDEQTQSLAAQVIPEENLASAYGEPEDFIIVLRSRWYRQALQPGACVCSIHPETDATIQCMLCLKSRVPAGLSYHCSGECLRLHWPSHRNYHSRFLQQAQTQYLQNGVYENGFGSSYTTTGFARISDIQGYEQSMPSEQEWMQVGSNRCYTPSLEDVGCVLKYECSLVYAGSKGSIYSNGSYVNGHSTELPSDGNSHRWRLSKETARVKPAPLPPVRAMIPLNTARIGQDSRFTVLSYNLLADLYASQGDYYHSYCPAWAISWHYRRQNLTTELTRYHCDILCLQEVQSNHYEDYLKGALAAHGYEGVYKKKTNDMFTGKCSAIDGCATFYRKDRFELIKKYEVEFNKAAVTTANQFREPIRNSAMQRLSKDNVAIIVVLESKDMMFEGGKCLVCVANTHIHSVPENSDVKIWQVHTLLKGLEKIASSTSIPIIVTGDFNSEPGSAPHSLMVNKIVDHGHPDVRNDPAQFLTPLLPVRHSLPLLSAYSAFSTAIGSKENKTALHQQKTRMDPRTGEPLFTNYTKTYKVNSITLTFVSYGRQGTLDYIFYTPDLLTPTALLELPSEEEAEIGLPNARYSSDHICIMAEFQITHPVYDQRI